MKRTCPKCRHIWDADIGPADEAVVCPGCGVRIRVMRHARRGVDPDAATQALPENPENAKAEEQPLKREPPPAKTVVGDEPNEALVGQTLGGYRIERLIGVGGMGAVFQARQLSLDRDVALKVLPHRLAGTPVALSRFVREALSAAQLTHHNVVQVYDVGAEGEKHFISMEFVRGRTFSDIIRNEGRLPVDDAAGYALQAARGLEYAHAHGIIHRDIKPDNLMVNEQGVVKIADMGLAKIVGEVEAPDESPADLQQARADITLANRGMGTPSYMSPEQARDARSVDARADQYSLGCTVYYLCAGRAPYCGDTAQEVIAKHLREPLVALDTHVPGVPHAFQAIVERMLQKAPEDRYPDMGAVVRDLEIYLGLDAEKGPYRPREHHLAVLDAARADFYAARPLRWRRWALAAFWAGCVCVMGGALLLRSFVLAGAAVGLAVLAPVCFFVFDGIATRGYFFRRVRGLLFGMSPRNWLAAAGAAALGTAVLYFLGWWAAWGAVGIVSAGLAAAYEFGVARRLRLRRAASLEKIRETLRELRLKGLSEEALQQFVCRFSSGNWEEFFENLFGYQAMVAARGRWAPGDAPQAPRSRHAAWRDPLVRWLDQLEDARRTARERREVASLEAVRLKAEGMDARAARRAAEKEAELFTRSLGEKHAALKRQEEKKRREAEGEAGRFPALTLPVRRSRWGLPVFRLARLALGLALAAIWLGPLLGRFFNLSPPPWPERLAALVASWGLGHPWAAGVAGVMVALSAFSGRVAVPSLMVLGAVLATAYRPLARVAGGTAQLEALAFWGGAILLAGGLVVLVMDLLAGGRRR